MRNFIASGGSIETRNDNWETPPEVFQALDKLFDFQLDACASDANHLCKAYFTEQNSCLDQSWADQITGLPLRCFNNPPYSKKRSILEQAYKQSLQGAFVCNLIPNATEASWFQLWGKKGRVWLLDGRIQFLLNGKRATYVNKKGKEVAASNTKGSALIFFDPFITQPSVHFVDLDSISN